MARSLVVVVGRIGRWLEEEWACCARVCLMLHQSVHEPSIPAEIDTAAVDVVAAAAVAVEGRQSEL